MSNYLMFWLSKSIVEFGIALGILAISGIVLLALWLPTWRKQSKCSHDRVHETQACDAICLRCGKNLGFIDTWREQQQCK
ncbi:hypothetical protein LMG7143_01628 [Ralstonia thomasii]|jgi:hypothetical protein|uniref:Transmembrane protein n=2 Tax=Ralstonia TaxID=48736 RepID=A0ABM9JG48_9RALS|nr:hypothetical protein LMG7143_01628 [Ralstonia sp. LMG 18095]CAJ0792287.1 hypothetical protein LMG18095_02294 [Ralstonia sp. LMG 18095]